MRDHILFRLINILLTREEIYLGVGNQLMTPGTNGKKLDPTVKPFVPKRYKIVQTTEVQEQKNQIIQTQNKVKEWIRVYDKYRKILKELKIKYGNISSSNNRYKLLEEEEQEAGETSIKITILPKEEPYHSNKNECMYKVDSIEDTVLDELIKSYQTQ